MSFWGSVGSAVAPALGKALGGGAAAFGLGSLFGPSKGSQKRALRDERNYHSAQSERMLRLGNQLDLENQKEMFNYRIGYGRNFGLNTYEMLMGPAGGAGGGTTGSGQTLGNSMTQNEASMRQARVAQSENAKDRQASIVQTAMQTQTQKDVAEIESGDKKRGQDLQKEIADNVLSLNTRELNEVKLPQAAAQLQLTRQQLQTEINKTATSSERFQKEMKQLSMGPANLLVELTMRDKGISLADDSFMKLSEEKRQEILTELLAMASTLYVEASGFDTVTDKVKGKTDKAANSIADLIADLIVRATGGSGIEATNAPPNVPNLGARFSQPGASGPNMNYR